MTNNPYQSPLEFPDDQRIREPRQRPLGISILAVLHTIGGLFIGALGVFLVTRFDEGDSNATFAWVVIIAAPLITALSFATAIGLWLGRKCAWWLATIYYFQFVVGGAILLTTIFVVSIVQERPLTQRSFELLAKHSVEILIFSLLSWYMTKRNVFAYFGYERLTRFRALAISTGVILVLAVFLGLLVVLALSRGERFP